MPFQTLLVFISQHDIDKHIQQGDRVFALLVVGIEGRTAALQSQWLVVECLLVERRPSQP